MALTLSDVKEIFEPEIQRWARPRHGFITELLFGGMPKKIDGMSVGWDEIKKYATVAPLYGNHTSAVERIKEGGEQKTFDLAFYKSKATLRDSEGMARLLGTTQFSDQKQAENIAVAMLEILKDQYEEIARRKDLLCISAAWNSYLDLVGYGVDKRVTFYRPPALDITLAPADRWAINGTVNIPLQFNNLKLLFQKESMSGVINGAIMNSTTAQKFITNTEIKSLRKTNDGWTQGTVGIDDSMLADMGVQKLGIVENIEVFSFDYWYEEEVGGVMVTKNAIPNDEVMFFSKTDVTAKNQIYAGTPPISMAYDSPLFQGFGHFKKVQNPNNNNISVMGIKGDLDNMALHFVSMSAETPIIKKVSTMRVKVA